MESYTQGPSKPNMETLFTLRLLDKDGQLAFFVTFIGTPKANSGPIPAMAAQGRRRVASRKGDEDWGHSQPRGGHLRCRSQRFPAHP